MLENALKHSDQAEPSVELHTIEHTPERAAISITDTGPGIPDAERDVLEQGEETPLLHGNGLGLWLVNWIVVLLEGSLSIEDNSPRGTVVTLYLPTTTAEMS